MLHMIKNTLKNLVNTVQNGQIAISRLSAVEKKTLEKKWDVEHAYYSSALEGSKLDKSEFESLARESK